MDQYDVVIVGAGPAGLSAALMLGRCRRRVVVIDDGAPRNRAARATHGFLTRDGTAPSELLKVGRADLARYKNVHLRTGTVAAAEGKRGAFLVRCDDGETFRGRRLVLATGVVDELPDIPGLKPLYGRTVHHCPFCDAYEYADQPLAVYGRGRGGVEAALVLRAWSADVALITNGKPLARDLRTRCVRHGVAIREQAVVRLVGRGGRLERVEFAVGPPLESTALFFATSQRQRSDIARTFGCKFTATGAVMTKDHETTSVPGLYVVGDASHREQKVAVAAAEGTLAGMKIHESLWSEELRRRHKPR